MQVPVEGSTTSVSFRSLLLNRCEAAFKAQDVTVIQMNESDINGASSNPVAVTGKQMDKSDINGASYYTVSRIIEGSSSIGLTSVYMCMHGLDDAHEYHSTMPSVHGLDDFLRKYHSTMPSMHGLDDFLRKYHSSIFNYSMQLLISEL